MCLGGCIWTDRDRSRRYVDPYETVLYEMWFDDADIYCQYETQHQRSTWTLVAIPDTSYGFDEIESVWVEIVGSYLYTNVNHFELTPYPDGYWRYVFDNQGSPEGSYHCGNAYEFEFTAYDYNGYYTTTWVEW